MKNKKTKLIVSSLILSLGLSGCSFNLNNRSSEGAIKVEYDDELFFDNDSSIDTMLDFKEEETDKIDYNYLIEGSEYTKPTLAHVIDEVDLTSNSKFLDHKKEMTNKSFEESAIQPITLPIAFILFSIEDIPDLIDTYGDCDVNCKKLYTIDGDILYYVDSTVTFNISAEKYIGLDIKENDTMNCKVLYRLENDNSLTILYRNQTGIKDNCNNVQEKNFNNSKELVIPIEKTIFSDLDGEYDEEYLLEALDQYNGTNNYYNESNEDKDFSFIKK